jgi:putative methionine-R-sulfoxide reductase with GAF domain
MPAGSAALAERARGGVVVTWLSGDARQRSGEKVRPPVAQPSRYRSAIFLGRTRSYPCKVMRVVHQPTTVPDRRRATASAPAGQPTPARRESDQLDQLRFIHDVARLATTARTWDELLETVVDGTRDALHADVSSLYLLDRDGAYLTLAATNGLDRFQIGRARVPFGEGVTGSVAKSQLPLVIPDVKDDPRFLWVRGIDQRRFVSSMLSVPLTWHDQTVGVLNVQTEHPRDFSTSDVAQLSAVADLLGRHRRERPPAVRGRGTRRGPEGHRRGAQ